MTVEVKELYDIKGSGKKRKAIIVDGSPFVVDEDGFPKTEFYKDKEKVGTGDNDWGCLYFPSSYEKHVGKKKPVYSDTIFGVKEWHPIMSAAIMNMLEDQGPGTTDMQLPLKMEHNDKVYIFVGDGAIGDSLTIVSKEEYNKSEVLRALESFHLDQSEEDDDEW